MDLLPIVLPTGVALIVLVTGFVQWRAEQRETRRIERDRLAALYVNPFLEACEELQSRLYNLLELGGIQTLSARFPDGSHATETLYLIARYLGWASASFRYGPLTRDPTVIRHSEAVRNAFASSAGEVDPFCFFRQDQRLLGQIVMSRQEGPFGIELDSVSLTEFRELLDRSPLNEMSVVKESLAALESAADSETLVGQSRLRAVQNALVDLIDHIEKLEGFSLFVGVRQRA